MSGICGHEHDEPVENLADDIEAFAVREARARGFCRVASVEALTRAAMLYAAKEGCPRFSEFVRRIEGESESS
jgi:hypothetical protein